MGLQEAYFVQKICQFIQVPVLPQPVSVRRSDLRINATHVLRAAGRDRKQIDKIRKEHSTAFDIVLNSINSNHQGTYVDFSIGIRLCQQYGLAELEERLLGLQPASEEARPTHVGSLSGVLESLPKSLSFPELAQTQMPSSNNSVAKAVAEVTGFDSKHVQMIVEDQTMLLRKEDCFLNATQIIKLAKKDKNERKMILEKMKKHTKVDVKRIDVRSAICGSWVNLQHGQTLCKHLGLERQLQPLLEYAQRLQGDDVETDRPQDLDYLVEKGVHPLFVAVRALPEPVMIRRLDWRVNSSQMLGVAGRNESDMVQIRTEYRGAYDSVQHEGFKYNGTYVDFDVAMDLCRRYGLVGLESQIRQVRFEEQHLPKTIPERTNSDVQPGDAASQTGVSPRADSASPQEWRESQHTELISSPDSSDPEDNQIQVNNLGEEYPVLDAASESSISSREASIARESDPSSIRLRATTALFHQHTQYSFRQTDPPPPPAPISHYNSWDYQPQRSRLSEVNLDLKPQSWETASPYKSFTDIC